MAKKSTGAPEDIGGVVEEVAPVLDKWDQLKAWAGTHRETPCASSDGKNVCDLVLAAMAKIEQGVPTVVKPDEVGAAMEARLLREENENQE